MWPNHGEISESCLYWPIFDCEESGLWELKLKRGCLSFPWFFLEVLNKSSKIINGGLIGKNTLSGKILMCFQAVWPYLLQRQMHCHCVWSMAPFLRIEKATAPSRRRWDHGFSGQHGGLLSESCSFWWSLVAWHETQVPDVGKQACFSCLILYFTVFLVFRKGSQIDTSPVE